MSSADEPKLYGELAPWFHLLTSPSHYPEEAELYGRLLVEKADGPVTTVLELGSGGGNNASHLKRHFELTLVDRSPEMLELSRGLNPESEHVEGDMRTVRLDRTFDAVFVHDALAYILTEPDLQAVFETAYAHCRPGGSAVFVPDYVHGDLRAPHGSRRPRFGGRAAGLRYVEWVRDRSLGPDASRRRLRVPHPRGRERARGARSPRLRTVSQGNLASLPRSDRLRRRRVEPQFADEPAGQVVFACQRKA